MGLDFEVLRRISEEMPKQYAETPKQKHPSTSLQATGFGYRGIEFVFLIFPYG
jgi:hypothetical protein